MTNLKVRTGGAWVDCTTVVAAHAGGGGGELSLPLVDWEGGPAYWEQFPKADAAGWSDPSFFPIAVFLGKPDSGHPEALADVGINVYMAAEYESPGLDLTEIEDAGIWVIATPDNPYEHDFGDEDLPQVTAPAWDFSEIGSHPNVVGWFLCDEPDMEYGGWPGDGETNRDQDGFLVAVQGLAAQVEAYDDGRFKFANFGNGVLNTFWSPDTLDEMVDEIHGMAVDKYAYTSEGVRGEFGRSADWAAATGLTVDSTANEDAAQTSAAYGWMVKQMRDRFQDPARLIPHWGFVEVKHPKLNEDNSTIITHAQRRGALWSAIINEARGVAYFQHFGDANWPTTDPNTGTTTTTESYTIVDGPTTYQTSVAAHNAEITALAPVINTQSYEWNFGAARMDTMLKAPGDGFAYLFAMVGPGGTTGSKTFTMPPELEDATTAVVLNESRSVSITGGDLTDSFANEYTLHIYKVAIP